MPDSNATPAPLTMTPEKEREYRAICTSGGTEVDPVFAELDATRAKLAEAEAQRDECEHRFTMTNVAHGIAESQEMRRRVTAESRVAALTEALGALADAGEQYIQDCLAAWDRAGQREARDDFRAAMTSARAAISPSQDAKGGRS